MYALLLMGCGAVRSQSAPPALEQMTLAQPSAQAAVQVDVRYQLRAAPIVSLDIEGTRSFGVFSIPIHLER